MDLFKLLGEISIENAKANQALDDTSAKGQQTQSKLSKAFSTVGKGAVAAGKVMATGLAAGIAAMGALTIKALNLSGELEQNMGGSEAVFGEYAEKMQATAKEAFSNMGLSTSDYLATANKMGALFQGAGFTIEESMNVSQKAMQRAADVASIMGIDTSSAMEAIAGAAKGNFTMMDNLGVAMNDTTLNAYALEKGINKTTQQMTNQEKISLAMEMFMEKTAYATGNYAKENKTLAGSLGTAKAALTNFLDGSGSVDDLVNSFSNAATVIVDNITQILPRLTTGLVQIVNKVIPMIPPLIQQLLPPLIEGAITLVQGIVDAIPMLLDVIIGSLPMLLDGIQQIFTAIVEALPALTEQISAALPTLLPMLIDGITNMIVTLCNNFSDIIQPIIDYLPDVIIAIVEALCKNTPAMIDGIITLIMAIVEAIPQIIQGIVDALPTIISLIITAMLQNLPKIIAGLIQIVMGIVKSLPQIFVSLIQGIVNIFIGIWDAIKNVFGGSKVGDFFKGVFDKIKQAFATAVQWFKDIFGKAWNGIKNAFSKVGSFFKDVFGKIKNAFANVKNFFRDAFKAAWDAVKNVFSKVGDFFGNIWNTIKNKFTALGTKISNAISGAVRGAINAVISGAEKVVNGFLKMINGAIGIINKIPGVNISNVQMVSFKRLAEGGVVDKPTPALFGEDGAEAVVPLENNTGWINKVAQQLQSTLDTKNGITDAWTMRSIDLQREQVNQMQTLNGKIDNIIMMLAQFFPDALEVMNQKLVLDTGVLVAQTASAMDAELGKIAIRKGRGR